MFTPADYDQKAAELWEQFSESDRHGVRFGLFPYDSTTAEEQQGHDGQQLAVALMKHEARQPRTPRTE